MASTKPHRVGMSRLSESQEGLLWRYEDTLQKKAGISVRWKPKCGLREMRTRNKVGRVTLRESGTHLHIDILPKVDGSLTGMLKRVLGAEELNDPARPEDSLVGYHPSAWLMQVYVRLLDAFLTQIRARGVEQEEALRGRVRGRLMASAYYKRNAYTQPHVFPCRFTEWTPDNLPNQVLRHALNVCRRYLQRYRLMSEVSIQPALVRCEAALAHVTPARIRLSDYARVRPMLRGSFQPYQRITRLAFSIIAQEDPLDFEGHLRSEIPFLDLIETGRSDDGACEWSLINMPGLFEKYVRAVLGRKKDEFAVKCGGSIEPDLAPKKKKGGLVMDAKYKRWGTDDSRKVDPHPEKASATLQIREQQKIAFTNGHLKTEDVDNRREDDSDESKEAADDTGRVVKSDLYQLVAYAVHQEIRASVAALVYPCSTKNDIPNKQESTDKPKLVADRFGTSLDHDDPLEVYVLFAPLDEKEIEGDHLKERVEKLIRAAEEAS